MFGGMKHTSLIGGALLAASMFTAGSAGAADLGGGCCADLEERVAELEATTARKGNRVVSLQIGGAITNAIMFWDNGVDSDAYIVGNSYPSSTLFFKGDGKISPTAKAGFYVELGINAEQSFVVDETSDESISGAVGGASDSIFIRHSYVYLEDERLGRITLGQTSTATDVITEINLARSGSVSNSGTQLWMGAFHPIDSATGRLVGNAGNTGNGIRFSNLWGGSSNQAIGEGTRFDVVKYDSPSIAGFKLTAAWGENDMWDVALRYAGQWNSFKVAAGVGYQNWSGDSGTGAGLGTAGFGNCISSSAANNFEADCHIVGASAGIMHVPTGLFAHVAYGAKTDENAPGTEEDTSTSIYVQAGIEKNWFGFGATTLYGEWQNIDGGFFTNGAGGTVHEADTTVWGFGVNQYFASAATDLYIAYRHVDADATTSIPGVESRVHHDFEDFSQVMAGAKISF